MSVVEIEDKVEVITVHGKGISGEIPASEEKGKRSCTAAKEAYST